MIMIGNIAYTPEQLSAAIRCADWVASAYARADEENGGGGSVDWEDIDFAHDEALTALGPADVAVINEDAKRYNGQVADDDEDDDEEQPCES